MEGIFRRIKIARRLIIGNIRNTKVIEHIIDGFAIMAESYCTMMREALFNEHMTIEAAHFRNSEDANAAEGIRGCRQDFALGNIGLKLTVRSALQTEERNIPIDIPEMPVEVELCDGELTGRAQATAETEDAVWNWLESQYPGFCGMGHVKAVTGTAYR